MDPVDLSLIFRKPSASFTRTLDHPPDLRADDLYHTFQCLTIRRICNVLLHGVGKKQDVQPVPETEGRSIKAGVINPQTTLFRASMATSIWSSVGSRVVIF